MKEKGFIWIKGRRKLAGHFKKETTEKGQIDNKGQKLKGGLGANQKQNILFNT